MKVFKNLINGELVETCEKMEVLNPSDETIAGIFFKCSEKLANEALESAKDAFEIYRNFSILERQKLIEKFKSVLRENKNEIIKLLMSETGKMKPDAEVEFTELIKSFPYFIEEVKRKYSIVIPDYTNRYFNYLKYSPIGVTVSFLAWNYPLLNFGYKLAQVLATGNTCVMKPSEETPLATAYMGEIFNEVGFPEGILNIVLGTGEDLGKVLCSSRIPRLLTLVGSTGAGLKVVENSATSVKRFSMELGGNAPVIVFDDADIDLAVNDIISLKLSNAGQICVAPNRILVHEKIYDIFIKKFADKFKTYSCNNTGENIVMPVISEISLKRLIGVINDASEKGAAIICGGKRAERKGFYMEPTLITGITDEMEVYTKEIFGPIAAIAKFTDDDSIFSTANNTDAGLSAYVYTKEITKILEAEDKLSFGNIIINGTEGSINLPHSGLKQSGYGSTLGVTALDNFYDIKRISIKRY